VSKQFKRINKQQASCRICRNVTLPKMVFIIFINTHLTAKNISSPVKKQETTRKIQRKLRKRRMKKNYDAEHDIAKSQRITV